MSRNPVKELHIQNYQIIIMLTFLQNRDTPLHLSSKEGYSEIAEILIKSGASTSVVNKVSCVSVTYNIVSYTYTCCIYIVDNNNVAINYVITCNLIIVE